MVPNTPKQKLKCYICEIHTANNRIMAPKTGNHTLSKTNTKQLENTHTDEHTNIQKIQAQWIETWQKHKHFHQDAKNQEKKTCEMKTLVYMKLPPKKLKNYTQATFTKWETHPNTNNMTEQERYNHGLMHLATLTETRNIHETDEMQQCPTCAKEFLTPKALSHHRATEPTCKKQWKTDKPQRNTSPIPECKKKFYTNQQLLTHIAQHATEQQTHTRPYTSWIQKGQ